MWKYSFKIHHFKCTIQCYFLHSQPSISVHLTKYESRIYAGREYGMWCIPLIPAQGKQADLCEFQVSKNTQLRPFTLKNYIHINYTFISILYLYIYLYMFIYLYITYMLMEENKVLLNMCISSFSLQVPQITHYRGWEYS